MATLKPISPYLNPLEDSNRCFAYKAATTDDFITHTRSAVQVYKDQTLVHTRNHKFALRDAYEAQALETGSWDLFIPLLMGMFVTSPQINLSSINLLTFIGHKELPLRLMSQLLVKVS